MIMKRKKMNKSMKLQLFLSSKLFEHYNGITFIILFCINLFFVNLSLTNKIPLTKFIIELIFLVIFYFIFAQILRYIGKLWHYRLTKEILKIDKL